MTELALAIFTGFAVAIVFAVFVTVLTRSHKQSKAPDAHYDHARAKFEDGCG